jgi:nucleotide-binding universal stress UspA family protein
MGQIVVGIDGSRDSEAALFWAAREARLREDRLVILYAVHTPVTAVPFGGAPVLPPTAELKAYGENLLEVAAAMVADDDAPLDVITDLVVQPPVAALLEAARTADLIVVGSRGLGTVGAAFLGSISTRVASRATCPTVVIHPDAGEYRTTGPIVVGIDGPQSDAAFRFAVGEAQRRGSTVEAVHAYWLPVVAMPIEGTNITGSAENYARRTAEDHIEEFMNRNRHAVPDQVKVTTQVVLNDPAEALAQLSDTAALVVVGSRGRGAFRGMLLGSVSQRVLHRANGPVAVVHDAADTEPDQVGAEHRHP